MRTHRPDLACFISGALCRHSATGALVEFVGVVEGPRVVEGEDVGVFRLVEPTGPPIVADRANYRRGETFEPVHPDGPAALEVRHLARADGSISCDLNDIFGVRRALAGLPESAWDEFLGRWVQLGDQCEYDLSLIRADVISEAARSQDPIVAGAWASIADAMTAYLAWRTERRRAGTERDV